MRITSALRTRSARSQGDDQAIRGLLQLLGELFRRQQLAEQPVGASSPSTRSTRSSTPPSTPRQGEHGPRPQRVRHDEAGLMVRAAKVVALLEQIQDDKTPTTAALVAQCLYDRLDRGSQVGPVTEALEELRRRNLLSYSEKLGYKIQSTAGEEWERERRDLGVSAEAIAEPCRSPCACCSATPSARACTAARSPGRASTATASARTRSSPTRATRP
jgi:hypothetical protein